MAVDVRILTPDDDLAAMGRLVLDSYRTLPGHPNEPEYEDELADLSDRVARSTVFGAFDDGEGIGCVTYVADDSSAFAENLRAGEASFRMLAVARHARGRGVGDALVRRCIDEATSAGRDALFIYSGSWMTTAHRLYERLGFERRPERDWVLDDPPILLCGYWRAV